MGLLTKLRKPVADYQEWTTAEMSNGDILDVWGSLGNRVANSVTITSSGDASIVRFNVSQQVYKEHSELHNNFVGAGDGALRSSPLLVDEIEDIKPNLTITADTTQEWTVDEIGVTDIKLVSIASGLKIVVA